MKYPDDLKVTLINGDCLEKLKDLPDNYVDSIVTDPPYGLSFMGKKWDYDVPSEDIWRECLRVLKPGGHLLAFAGTRTQHRMAVRIEDAGFEIRDMIAWIYGCLSEDSEVLTKDGFKRFHKITQDDTIRAYDTQNDIYKWEKPQMWSQYAVEQDTAYRIKSDTTDQIVSRNHNCLVEREGKLVFVKAEDLLQMERVPVLSGDISVLQEGQGELLHPELLWQGEGLAETILSERVGQEASRKGPCWANEPGMEGWSNILQEEGQVFRSINQVCSLPEQIFGYGSEGRICDGAPVDCSNGTGAVAIEERVRSPRQSRCDGQPPRELDAVCIEHGPQEVRTRTSYRTTLATVTPVKYTGLIFCPTVSTGAFVARRNGKVFVTGNSGFPKSLDVSKAIDKAAGAEREVVGVSANDRPKSQVKGGKAFDRALDQGQEHQPINITAPATPEAQQWAGWGTALKPALEPITVARKPLIGTVAENVLTHGTGGINIDGCRVEGKLEGDPNRFAKTDGGSFNKFSYSEPVVRNEGRFPANLIHDGSEEVVGLFPANRPGFSGGGQGNGWHKQHTEMEKRYFGDKGSAARFFYCAKSSPRDRNDGLDGTLTVKYNSGVCYEENMVAVQLLEKVISDMAPVSFNIGESGASIMAQCHQGSLSTTLTKIRQTIELKTFSLLTLSLTSESTQDANLETESGGSLAKSADSLPQWLLGITNGQMELARGASRVASQMLQAISDEDAWKPMTNIHSTVKPTDLMRYLCRLVTPLGGTVLDPFMGSGSTGKAAVKEGFSFIGIELDPEYMEIAKARIGSHDLHHPLLPL